MKSTYLSLCASLALSLGACGDDTSPVVGADASAEDVANDASADAAPDTAVSDAVGATDIASNPDTAPDATEDVGPLDTSDTTGPVELLPGERGPWNVGYRTETIRYTPADGSPSRSLRVVYWYPTDATIGDEVLYQGLLPAEGVLGDVALAPLGAKAPVVIFSHGNGSFAEQSHFFTTFLATHGFVVVAPDHTGNTVTDRNTPAEIFHWRPLDLSAVVDHLDALASPHFLADALGTDRAVAGHSFGGYTALAVTGAAWDVDAVYALCESVELPLGACDVLTANEALYRAGFLDGRLAASIPMSPGASLVFGAEGVSQVAVPTLLFTGTLDQTTPNTSDGDPIWGQLAASPDNIRVNFATGAHFTFSDACSLPFDVGSNDGCGAQFVDPDEAHTVVNAMSLAFLKRHLLKEDNDGALLDGSQSISEDAEITLGRTE